MIRDLLAELERGGAAIGVDALARRLGTTPAAVEGALELLARKGRLVRAGSAEACGGCAAKAMCNPLLGQTTRYIPVPAAARSLPMAVDAVGRNAGPCGAGNATAMGDAVAPSADAQPEAAWVR